MTTSINWPVALPLPSMNGYQIKPVPNVDRTAVDVGPARQRRRSIATRDTITVQFELTLAQLALFEAFHRNVVFEGAVWFNITMLGGTGLVAYEARFLVGQDVTYTPRNGQNWLISCTFEVRDRPVLAASDVAALGGEDLSSLLSVINSIDLIVHSQLWTS